jgi:hypothetical protein
LKAAPTFAKMYQPPQESNMLLDDSQIEPFHPEYERDSFLSHFKLHTHAAPFSYEYVFEDGRLPFLSEIHPVKKKNLPSIFGMPAFPDDKHDKESTKSKMKRALSLSRKPHVRSVSHQIPRIETHIPRIEAPVQIAPKLILPTPSTSPEPYSVSRSSSNANTRSSWASMDDDEHDLALLDETAMGRLDTKRISTPTYELRRDKAFALLGIDMPMTPPYTPAGSKAPSIANQSRLNSRRTSVEQQRLSHHSHTQFHNHLHSPHNQLTDAHFTESKKESSGPSTFDTSMEKTPKASSQEYQTQIKPVQSPTYDAPRWPLATIPSSPRPTLKRKQSKFIEHLDEASQQQTTAQGPVSTPIAQAPISSPTTAHAPMSTPTQAQASVPTVPQTATQAPAPLVLFPKIVPPRKPLPLNPASHITSAEPPITLPENLPPSFPANWPLTLPSLPISEGADEITPCEVQYPSHLMPRRSMSTREPARKSWGAVVCTAQARPIVAMGSAKLVSS